MELKQWSAENKNITNIYLEFLRKRSRGLVPTGAKFIRDFVLNHPAYQKDSIVSKEIAYDLICMIEKLENEEDSDRESLRIKLLGESYI